MVGSVVRSTTCCVVSLYSSDSALRAPALIHVNSTPLMPLLCTASLPRSKIGSVDVTSELGMYSKSDELIAGGTSYPVKYTEMDQNAESNCAKVNVKPKLAEKITFVLFELS